MSLDNNTKEVYFNLKQKMDTAYAVFKRDPVILNATNYTTAANNFKDFCIRTMAILADDLPFDSSEKEAAIIADIDNYRTCKQCGSELLYLVSKNHYIASSDFVEEFPGWCHTCLVEHCCSHDCETCTVSKDPVTCSFKDIKNFYSSQED